jgi:hypothetical protein
MAPGRPLQNHPQSFDDAKLQQMTEPLTVRVERLKGSTRQPITLPDNADGTPGSTGWSKEAIQRVESWVVTEIVGGGMFEFTVTDSTVPAPMVMKWRPFFDPREYPERPLDPNSAIGVGGTPSFAPQPPISLQPQGQPMRTPYLAPAPYQVPGFSYPPMPNPPPVGTPAYGAYREEADRREEKAELRRLRDENERRERESTEARHRAELDRDRAAANDRFGRLESSLTGLVAAIKDMGTTSKGPSPELAAMQMQLEQERRDRENDRRERETRELIQRMQDSTKDQIAEMKRQFDAVIAQMANTNANRTDPMITFMQAQTKEHSEALKEIARLNASTVERIQANVMKPQEMIALARESQRDIEAVTTRMTGFFGNVVEMQQKVMDNALNMQPQGNSVVEAVSKGLDNLKEWGERYVGAKATEQKIQAHASVAIAQAQAQAIEAQARASNPMAFSPQEPIITPPPPPQDQLAGPAVAQAPETAKVPRIEKLWGRTDEEWFGPVLDEVNNLREGVKAFHESLKSDPPTTDAKGNIVGVTPDQAAAGVMHAVQLTEQHGIKVPAIAELLMPGQLAAFMGLLLPDGIAADNYRTDVVTALQKLADPMSDAEDDADDDDDDDGNPDDEPEIVVEPARSNGVTQAPKAPVTNRANGKGRARA